MRTECYSKSIFKQSKLTTVSAKSKLQNEVIFLSELKTQIMFHWQNAK